MNINLEDLPLKMRKQAEAKIKAQRIKNAKVEDLVEKQNKNDSGEAQELTEVYENGCTHQKKSKYKNIPCEAGGIRFDSKKERRRFLELKGMYEAGLITDLKLQHHFTLSEAFKDVSGNVVRRVEYIADFTYFDSEGKFVIEDVKSNATRQNAVYSLKKRLMAAEGYLIQEV